MASRSMRLVRMVALLLLVIPSVPGEGTSPRAITDIGVLYTPRHNWEYPVLGGWVDAQALALAIADDLRLLSKYVTHIRTLSATYHGVDIVPIAHRHGLRVIVGTAIFPTRTSQQDVDAVVRAARDHPEAIAAVLIGENELQDRRASIPGLHKRMVALTSRLAEVTTTPIKVGIFEDFVLQRSYELSESDQKLIGQFDVLGTTLPPKMQFGGPIKQVFQQQLDRLSHAFANLHFILETGMAIECAKGQLDCSHFISARRYFHAMEEWSPMTNVTITKLWSAAFDLRPDDLSTDAPARRSGLFSADKMRKIPNFPRAINVSDDPIELRSSADDLKCPVGMYHLALLDHEADVRLCLMSGYNFRYPVKFDERSIMAVCTNDACGTVQDALAKIPNPPPCPFDSRFTRSILEDWILGPMKQYCPARTIINPTNTTKNPASCNPKDQTMLIALSNSSNVEMCEANTGFRLADLTLPSEEMVLKMCVQPSCIMNMQQMANPAASPFRCSEEGMVRREFIEMNLLRPFFNACYEDSHIAFDYFDTTYRRTRQPYPLLRGTKDGQVKKTTASLSELMSKPVQDMEVEDSNADGQTNVPAPHRNQRQPTRNQTPESNPRNATSLQEASTEVAFHFGSTSPVVSSRLKPSEFISSGSMSPSGTDSVDDSHRTSRMRRYNQTLTVVISLVAAVAALFALVLMWRKTSNLPDRDLDAYHEARDLHVECEAGYLTELHADPILSSTYVPPQRLRDIKLLGSGGQALVYLVEYRGPIDDVPATLWKTDTSRNKATKTRKTYKQFLAAKRLVKSQVLDDPHALSTFADEIRLVSSLRHPNIVTFVGATWSDGLGLQALFEYEPSGDLWTHLSSTPRYKWTLHKLQVAVDVIEALAYVHSLDPPLVHRDIKSRNVLLSGTIDPFGRSGILWSKRARCPFRAKLTDFGVARLHSEAGNMTTGVGTSRWLAPEVIIGGGEYDQSCDVYSFGVLLSELDTHAVPFTERRTPTGDALPDMALLQMIVVNRITPAFSKSCPEELLSLATRCLAYEPTERPTAQEIVVRIRRIMVAMG